MDDGRSVAWLGHATTIATNALLGQMGLELPRVVLVTTQGFRDLIEIGRQNRSRVYDLFVERPRMLVAREDRITVRERIGADGSVVEPLDEASLDRACEMVRTSGAKAVAVCFLHSYANAEHERLVAQRLRDVCDAAVVTSAEVNPEYREYERFSTAVVNAALVPIAGDYLRALALQVRETGIEAPLLVMRSDGGLSDVAAAASRPASLIESGPAGGAIAAAGVARSLGLQRVLCFDMGGTTAKAGIVIGGEPSIVTEFEAAGATHSGRSIKGSGYPVRAPFIDLCEASAGGGTIAWIDEANALRVGPLSAGADPGPACYGRSDRATVTDANVVLGRLNRTHLLGGAFPIDAGRSRAAVERLALRLGMGVEQTAEGIVRIVDDQMAKILRIVSVERGLDPREFTMVAFGGNGPLHACELAQELGIARIVVPRDAGSFSAMGLLVAQPSVSNQTAMLCGVRETTQERLRDTFEALERDAVRALKEQHGDLGAPQIRRRLDARYRGQSFELQIEYEPSLDGIERRFHGAHRQRYGYAVDGEVVEIVNARVTVSAARTLPRREKEKKARKSEPTVRDVWTDGAYASVPIYDREGVATQPIAGPAIVEQYDCTTYAMRGWTLQALESGELSMERA